MPEEIAADLRRRIDDQAERPSTRFGVSVREQDYDRLGEALDAVRRAERSAEREALTRRVY